jgi:hypothetical protein
MENKHILKRAVAMAQESIYDNAAYLGDWNEYAVYEPTFNDDEVHYIGIPQYILEKGGMLRWTKTETESFAIMDAFPSVDEDFEE